MRCSGVLKVYWLAVAEAPFIVLLFPVYLAARLLSRWSEKAGAAALVYRAFVYFYLARLNYLYNFLAKRRGED
jgi:hypothetical protein